MPPAFKSVAVVGKSDAASLPDVIDQLATLCVKGFDELERRVDAHVVVWRDEVGHVVTTLVHLTGYAQGPIIRVTTEG